LLKRIFDLLLSIIGLTFLSPFLLIIRISIIITYGTPILFKQLRPGLYGKPFCFYKFSTMTNKKDKEGNFLSDEKRLTKLGVFLRKTSLDELPSLWNVLNGDMSLVGPRPLLMEYMPLYSDEQSRRHEVKPGITGWAQVNGRNTISWEEKFKFDIWYVENQSFVLDIKILLMTVEKVFRRVGINQPGHVTMEKFRGRK
jgi:sugar transferase EpsL